jgi:hypothetical protein
MCLVLIALDSHPDYPLIVAANRDEFYDRPTAPARFWDDAPAILAGRDLKAGGPASCSTIPIARGTSGRSSPASTDSAIICWIRPGPRSPRRRAPSVLC